MADWAGKLVGAVARIAALFHLGDRAMEPQPWAAPITPDATHRAIWQWVREHRIRTPWLSRAEAQARVAAAVARAAQERQQRPGLAEVSHRA